MSNRIKGILFFLRFYGTLQGNPFFNLSKAYKYTKIYVYHASLR